MSETYDVYENEFLEKIDSGKELSKGELRDLICRYEIESEYGENRRWTRSVESIVGKKDSQNISQMNFTISQKKLRNMSMTKQSM